MEAGDCLRSGGRFIEPAGHHRLRLTITDAGNSSINKDPITEQLTDFHHHHQLLSDHNHVSTQSNEGERGKGRQLIEI